MKHSFTPDWWRIGTIYQVYPRSFFSAKNKEVGDLNGIRAKIDYLKSLGADALWLSPFFKSPMKDYGYDVEDYCAIDPMFGTMADFDKLLAATHRAGLKLIIDQVYNHTSDRHAWFVASRQDRKNPKADWYVWADPKKDGSPPNNWQAVFGGSAWQWDARRCQYYLHQFLKEQPDLNFNNPQVQKAILKVAKFWLDKGVDGFRLDTAHCYLQDPKLRDNPPASAKAFNIIEVNPYFKQEHQYDIYYKHNLPFIESLRALTDKYKARMLVGEIGGDRQLDILSLYTQTQKRLHTAYTFGFLSHFDAERFNDIFLYLNKHLKDGWPCWAFSNHDVMRVAGRGPKEKKHLPAFTRMMMTLLLTMRGTPCIYQGEELGLPEADIAREDLRDPFGIEFWPEYKGRDGCRTPMPWEASAPNGGFSKATPWLPADKRQLAMAADKQAADKNSMLNFTRRLLQWRKELGDFWTGDMEIHRLRGGIIGFTRTHHQNHKNHKNQKLLCLFNLTANKTEIKKSFEGSQVKLDARIDARISKDGKSVLMPPYGVCLIQSKQ